MTAPRESSRAIPAGESTEAHGEGELFDPAEHRPTSRRVIFVLAAVVVGLAILFAIGLVPRWLHRSAMADDERKAAAEVPQVRVVRVTRAAANAPLTLPGLVEPFQETSVYARANGYVRRWLVDIGAKVAKDEVLADLDLPDVDEELRQGEAAAVQAKAGIAQAKAQLELAQATDQRYQALRPSGVVSQQEADQTRASHDAQRANLEAAEAAYGSARANTRRLADLKAFGTIGAPFDGVVTMRSAEVGQLVASGMAGQPLFKVADVHVVRVFVNVPQLYAAGIRVGMEAPTTIREMPARSFVGQVARTANELDPSTRTLRTEVDLTNGDGALMAGMYAQVRFDVKRQDQPLFVPSTAVLFDAHGTRVAAVRDGVIRWTNVGIDTDMGDRLAVGVGLSDGDAVVVTPSDKLVDGTRVDAVEIESPAPRR